MSTDQPQLRFDDLYTVVYALIDDAKTRHRAPPANVDRRATSLLIQQEVSRGDFGVTAVCDQA
jgi:hypothetical protein